MDQIYIPKNREGLGIGEYVIVRGVLGGEVRSEGEEIKSRRPFFYGVEEKIEGIKMRIIGEIFRIVDESEGKYENVIITGSFLDRGFGFNDVDILLVGQGGGVEKIKKKIESGIGIKGHVILMGREELIKGVASDPLYLLMLSRFVARKRTSYNVKRKINYKLLDFYLLKSKVLLSGFDELNGNEKYYLTRNMVAINLFVRGAKIGVEEINSMIKKIFELGAIEKIKENMIDKKDFLKKYKKFYDETFELVMRGVGDGTK